ncbi:metallophosphoesterase [Anaerosinus massiliensis]|uniref:metallophosphoesterase n=1 Tax=Massilibacillus massiliensis TaxID=1806837 RepID=UPI0018FE0E25|nr:metallophosphoesterase [Massilibacillus massiliensis]
MKGPSIYFLFSIMLVMMLISYLSITLAMRVFPFYREVKLKKIYWCLNFIAFIGLVFGRGRFDMYSFSGIFVEVTVIWFMSQIFVLLLLPVCYIVKKAISKFFSDQTVEVDMTRRRLIKGIAVSLPLASVGMSSYGALYGSRQVEVLKHDILLQNLDPSLENFKIAQISDAHIGMFFSVRKFRLILDRLKAENPDVLVITGDLIDEVGVIEQTVDVLNEYAPAFQKGIYFSWGNHEYFRNFAKIEQALNASKVTILRNRSEVLVEAKRPLYLLGVDYPWADEGQAQIQKCKDMTEQAMEAVPADATKVLLSHHPGCIDAAYEQGIDLTLTGHTHGGQIAILGQSLLPVRYKYMRGMYKTEQQYGYVSTGAGSWFPFRIGCPAEVAIFTLKTK